jgi:hypothetical protein
MKWLTYELLIPTWALFLALAVVALVAVALTQDSVATELGRRAVESGIVP